MSGPPEPTNREQLRARLLIAIDCYRGSAIAQVDAVMAALEPTLLELDDRLYSCWEASMGEDL